MEFDPFWSSCFSGAWWNLDFGTGIPSLVPLGLNYEFNEDFTQPCIDGLVNPYLVMNPRPEDIVKMF